MGQRYLLELESSLNDYKHGLMATIDGAHFGNRVDGRWTSQAYDKIVESLQQSGLVGIN